MTNYVIVLNYFRKGIEHPFQDVQYATTSFEKVAEWLEHTKEAREKYLNLPMLTVCYADEDTMDVEAWQNLDIMRDDYYIVLTIEDKFHD